ncbi:hypothetical protein [Dactylosporangium sp. CA-139066]|uniref:hypothetical protein n=1 Tax=Dactylosporangium sp. CA-139066 TaxID=3239930 RepID=UPI003D8E5D83
MFTAARVLAGTVMAGIALTALGACSSAHHPDLRAAEPPVAHAAAQPPVASTVPQASAAATVAAPKQSITTSLLSTQERSPMPSLSTVPPAPNGFGEACTPAALLAYVRTQHGPATGFGEVKIDNCVGGYARLYAKANPDPTGQRPAGDQFFLQYTGGHWATLARGAAIDCGDAVPVLAQACAVFDAATR